MIGKVVLSGVVLVALAVPMVGAQPGAQGTGAQQRPVYGERVKVSVPKELQQKLNEMGFAVSPLSREARLARLYRWWSFAHYPVVVTSDAALHTAHLQFDWFQRFLEIAHLRGDLINLTDALVSKLMEYCDEGQTREEKEAALLGVSYFTVGKRLLAGGELADAPAPWQGRMASELKLINEAEGFALSPLFGYREDYTQYKPRGHYARSQEFASYFRAMQWFGRMGFRLKTEDPQRAEEQTRAAILICRALQTSKVKGENAMAVWRRIYETTAFFAGRSDDLLPTDYAKLLTRSEGAHELTDPNRLSQFMASAQELRKPRILGSAEPSSRTTAAPDWREATQGMRLFGQRYGLDADIMQRLTFDSVGPYRGDTATKGLPFTCVNANGMLIRALPRGLDVMSTFGFAEAGTLLHAEGDDLYVGYEPALAKLKDEVAQAPPGAVQADLCGLRLRAAAELARLPKGTLPKAMEAPQWSRKQLAAALGSWTELKHDTILYTKQPYAATQSAMAGASKGGGPVPPPPPPPRGYVEPMPAVYAAIRTGVDGLRERMQSLGYPEDKALTGHLESFAQQLRTLEEISQKELAGQALTDAEFRFIEGIGAAFTMPWQGYPHYRDVTEAFRTEMDDDMCIVADVFTDPNSRTALEEAVGCPMELYMVCPVDGEPTVCIGAVYSYYEFKRPITERMTDEEWRRMLEEYKNPSLPTWMDAYVVQRR